MRSMVCTCGGRKTIWFFLLNSTKFEKKLVSAILQNLKEIALLDVKSSYFTLSNLSQTFL